MKKAFLREYARLLALCGVNIKKGDPVIINAELDQPAFITILVEECYRAGASRVIVDWSHQPLEKLNIRYRSQRNLAKLEDFEIARLQYRLDKNPAMLYILSADPDGLKGMNQKKHAKAIKDRYPTIKPFKEQLENKYKWCIAAVPGRAWAKKVFPNMPVGTATTALWKAILYTSRVIDANGNLLDSVAAWEQHNRTFRNKCEKLNNLHLTALHYRSANGTDLRVGLNKEGLFLGGGEFTLDKEYFNPNIPTEEVFTTPKAGDADGIVYSSMPLSYKGQLIENFSIRFEKGCAVRVQAEKNQELLEQMIAMDEGAARLGECALVPCDSPIHKTGILFYETLFDENAACHLALGRGFSNCIRDYEKYTSAQLTEMGINQSMIHVDFMIGTDDLSITGITENGEEIAIFENGNWAL